MFILLDIFERIPKTYVPYIKSKKNKIGKTHKYKFHIKYI